MMKCSLGDPSQRKKMPARSSGRDKREAEELNTRARGEPFEVAHIMPFLPLR
jgi:hypothetical protein